MKIQEITSLEQLDNYLGTCKAIPIGVPTDGNGFYKLMCQTFKYPNGGIKPREYIDKNPATIMVPEDPDGNFIMVIQPAGLTSERSLIEFLPDMLSLTKIVKPPASAKCWKKPA